MQITKPTVIYDNNILKANKCINQLVGDRIDFIWNIIDATMELFPSKQADFSHEIIDKKEYFKGVPLLHQDDCQLLQEHLTKNDKSLIAPCVVILIQNKHNGRILATQRHQHMSFGNQWVLPGGHLQKGESIYEGGLRQCEQQVGLRSQHVSIEKDPSLIVWESVLTDFTINKIKKIALVIFLKIQCDEFQVIEQKSQVKSWEWRSFEAEQYPWGGGWAEGHLCYLKYLAKKANESQSKTGEKKIK